MCWASWGRMSQTWVAVANSWASWGSSSKLKKSVGESMGISLIVGGSWRLAAGGHIMPFLLEEEFFEDGGDIGDEGVRGGVGGVGEGEVVVLNVDVG